MKMNLPGCPASYAAWPRKRYRAISMAERKSVSELLVDPTQGRRVAVALLVMLSWLGLMLRLAIDAGGVLDTDVLNFGLAGYRFVG